MPHAALAQAFLLHQQWWAEATTGVRGLSSHQDVVEFTARQLLDMASPSNFIGTNPQVLCQSVASGGMNLAQCFSNWARDALAVQAGAPPRGVENFAPGRQVALTPGCTANTCAACTCTTTRPSAATGSTARRWTCRGWRLPLFVVAAERDHVSPWRSVYKVLRMAHLPATFLLVSVGHNVGIVSPPDGQVAQAGYRLATHAAGKVPVDPQEWLHAASVTSGSWWPAWSGWLARQFARLARAHVFVDRLAGNAIGRGRHGRQAALVDRFAAIQALAVAAVVDAAQRGQHLFQFERGVVGLGFVDDVARLAGGDVLEVRDACLGTCVLAVRVQRAAQQRAQFFLALGQDRAHARPWIGFVEGHRKTPLVLIPFWPARCRPHLIWSKPAGHGRPCPYPCVEPAEGTQSSP